MQRVRRVLLAAAAAVICLTVPRYAHALESAERAPTAERARRPSSGDALSRIQPQAIPEAAIVTTVAVPGGLSSESLSALRRPETMFSAESREVLVSRRNDGTRILSSPTRFLNVLVLTTDSEGGSSLRCVSTLDGAAFAMPEGRIPASGAEKE